MKGSIQIGAIVFPQMDQMDLTGPFTVLSRLPDSKFLLLWKEKTPVRDSNGLLITPDTTFSESPQLDVLIVPGGPGQQPLMEDQAALGFIRRQASDAKFVFSICTGALLCGAVGLLQGVRATTHWASHDLLEYFGAVPEHSRVVIDGKFVSAAGVTAGLDGALRLAALLCGETTAQAIQLGIEYAPEPPFASGTPELAPAEVLAAVQERFRNLSAARRATATAFAARHKSQSIASPGSAPE